MTDSISILLVDDHAMVRETLGYRLQAESGLRLAAQAGDAQEAVDAAAKCHPDVVLMDIDMPGLCCFEAARTILRQNPGIAIVFLSAFTHDHYIGQALAVGAAGYITKSESTDVVIAAIRKVAAGSTYYSPEIQLRIVIDGDGGSLAQGMSVRSATLSERELEILRYVGGGMSQKEAAAAACISVHTVHNHVTSIMKKLGLGDRAELVRYAIREGLVAP